ncbi:hypothetical protein CLIB1423_11S04038 [[Candida] railenensis]|uniref:Uncharacterized protein n=1 Tax=[Candida] railenensis TaxID=45579 RepID=A0A9P0QQG6_9ASCO|nr:hypothetical protein CLIB1423_11S04038 [[Candida] railenensis]
MPPLNKFFNNVRGRKRGMDKNLTANLIRHEYIVTGDVKAKRAQSKIESFLAKTMNIERTKENEPLTAQTLSQRIKENSELEYLQAAERDEVASKLISNLAGSTLGYKRTHGFTRILKLEPRLGEDKAPQSVLELVDSEYSIFFWYIAKTVARLELQGLPLDELTSHNVKKLVQFKEDGESRFKEAVEKSKAEFFSYNAETGEIENQEIKDQLLRNIPNPVKGEVSLLGSKKYKIMERKAKPEFELPKSPFLK